MNNPDIARARREGIRWYLVVILHKARPYRTSEDLLHHTIASIYPGTTALEIRQELDYLEERNLVRLTREPAGRWYADLTRLGIDLAEYTVDCQPGIARPEKYWSE